MDRAFFHYPTTLSNFHLCNPLKFIILTYLSFLSNTIDQYYQSFLTSDYEFTNTFITC